MLTVIIPTYEEAENIEPLLRRLAAVAPALGDAIEVLIVDNGSSDGTADRARELLGRVVPGRLVPGRHRMDLASAVIEGIRQAQGRVIAVMDADLSHPPELLPELYRAVERGADVAVASRYVRGGGVARWPLRRRALSRTGNWLVRPLAGVRDATSGYFACRTHFVKPLPLSAAGFKILLEILVKGRPRRVQEIPYVFTDRQRGSSKLSGRTLKLFAAHAARLYAYRWRQRAAAGREARP